MFSSNFWRVLCEEQHVLEMTHVSDTLFAGMIKIISEMFP